MRRFALTLTFVFLVGLIFYQCNTYIWQPVEKQMVATWIKSPQTETKRQEWTFTNDHDLYVVDIQLTSPEIRDTLISCTSTLSSPWKIENNVTKHFLQTEELSLFCGNESNPKWLIVKVTKSELYLTTLDDNRTKGAFQYGFVKK